MRALWIEDHQLIGDSLELLLDVVMPDVSLDKARDVETALQLVRNFPYEIILLDWWLGAQDGDEVMRRLRSAGCATPIIVVSGDPRESVKRRALELGAVGYVSKSMDPETLVDTIRRGLRGDPTQTLVSSESGIVSEGGLPSISVESAYPDLTARQADVFRRLMRGMSDKQIARELEISDTTVKTHVRAIFQIVGVRKRGEAVYEARVRGAGEY